MGTVDLSDTSEGPTGSREAIVSDRRGQKYIKMCAIHENALMRSAIDHDIGLIFPMYEEQVVWTD
jgi:hypothetical protein